MGSALAIAKMAGGGVAVLSCVALTVLLFKIYVMMRDFKELVLVKHVGYDKDIEGLKDTQKTHGERIHAVETVLLIDKER